MAVAIREPLEGLGDERTRARALVQLRVASARIEQEPDGHAQVTQAGIDVLAGRITRDGRAGRRRSAWRARRLEQVRVVQQSIVDDIEARVRTQTPAQRVSRILHRWQYEGEGRAVEAAEPKQFRGVPECPCGVPAFRCCLHQPAAPAAVAAPPPGEQLFDRVAVDHRHRPPCTHERIEHHGIGRSEPRFERRVRHRHDAERLALRGPPARVALGRHRFACLGHEHGLRRRPGPAVCETPRDDALEMRRIRRTYRKRSKRVVQRVAGAVTGPALLASHVLRERERMLRPRLDPFDHGTVAQDPVPDSVDQRVAGDPCRTRAGLRGGHAEPLDAPVDRLGPECTGPRFHAKLAEHRNRTGFGKRDPHQLRDTAALLQASRRRAVHG